MINVLLIANRGEIACRIMRTAKRLGIKTIAVYSSADKNALHVKMADHAYLLGPAAATQSYLNKEKLIAIAKQATVDAIHPGYGFLAEDASFAELCEKEGINFIGPPASAIDAMGDKRKAKAIMEKAKVPVVPGYQGTDQTLSALEREAKKIGLPVLIKAAAGGGGKGMRLITTINQLESALQSAKREAKSSFGDDTIFLEKYLNPARHVEVQIFLDKQGQGVYLFDRDCSIQRRHQKIIEEAPAPNLSDKTRAKMGKTAVKAAETIHYVGAGTFEFLVDIDENFYFMEMNTRLQVEHPVTEMITGLDLVEWQIRIANGEPLPLQQKDIKQNGHAFEARIYAENTENNFSPSIGKLRGLHMPLESNTLRIDSGIQMNDTITPYYDPMIAKLITGDKDRSSALQLLTNALEATAIIGVETNIAFLHRVCKSKAFRDEKINTHFIETHEKNLFPKKKLLPDIIPVFVALAKYHQQQMVAEDHAHESEDLYSPWFTRDNWNFFSSHHLDIRFWYDKEYFEYTLFTHEAFFQLKGLKGFDADIKANWETDHLLELSIHKKTYRAYLYFDAYHLHVFYEGEHYTIDLKNPNLQEASATASENLFIAPMPGTLIEIFVKPGESVKKGDRLLVLEAMKMEHTVNAPHDGTIKSIKHKVGDLVNEGTELIEFD